MVELIILLPLLSALIVGLFLRKYSDLISQILSTSLISISAILSYFVLYNVVHLKQIYQIDLFNWFAAGDYQIKWSLYVDSLTAIMLVVVNSVSALVHLYSIGYMHNDSGVPRFMSYLSLFTFFMLMLVTSNNIVQLFLGWEGVGLCSYLLIGFWYYKKSAYNAAIKAFIVNRIADVFFAVGIFALFYVFRSFEFKYIFSHLEILQDKEFVIFGLNIRAVDFICMMLFIGCMGKSAQLGLHTWLPDAMEGPTPVSALIHAATMVTAGVFLVSRFSFMFDLSPFALEFITFIGATTALFAATIALNQRDIKKIIAYSTCSQLGYMFFACGVSFYSGGIFHLMTHAFFKALLFLAAGSIIHAMSNEQDIFKMGGLARKIPVTFAAMLVGSIAIAGIPPLAGYFSKDAILEAAYASDSVFGKYAYFCGTLSAALTAFYSWRLLIKVFHGESNASRKIYEDVHESPLTMTIPLSILMVGSVVAGLFGQYILGFFDGDFLLWENVLPQGEKLIYENMHHIPSIVKIIPTILSVVAIAAAYILYLKKPAYVEMINKKFKSAVSIFSNAYYFDQFYGKVFVRNFVSLSKYLAKTLDQKIIDGFIIVSCRNLSRGCSSVLCKLQSGYLYHYAFTILFGVLVLLSWVIFVL